MLVQTIVSTLVPYLRIWQNGTGLSLHVVQSVDKRKNV